MNDLIEEWFDRYEMAEFDKFIYLWISFNSWISKQSQKKTDRDMVEWFKAQEQYESDFLKIVDTEKDIENAAGFFVTRKVTNMKNQTEHKMSTIYDFKNAVEVVYQVRCNLFHGDKSRDHWVDREIVQRATILLDGIYRPIITARRGLRTR